MPLPPLETERALFMKVESTPGTDVFAGTPLAADIIPVDIGSISIDPEVEEWINRNTMGAAGVMPSSIGAKFVTITWRQALRGKGAAYDDSPLVVPEVDRPVLGCVASRAIDTTAGAETVLYTPGALLSQATYTIYLMQKIPDGSALVVKVKGAVGTFTASGNVGDGPTMMEFRFQGVWDQADHAFVDGTLVGDPRHVFLQSAELQIGSGNYSPAFQSFSFALNNVIARHPNGNAATGYDYLYVVNREPVFTFDPDIDQEAASGFFAGLSAGTLHDLSLRIVAGGNYNKALLRLNSTGAAGAQVIGPLRPIVRNGISAMEVRLRATIALGANTEYGLLFDK